MEGMCLSWYSEELASTWYAAAISFEADGDTQVFS